MIGLISKCKYLIVLFIIIAGFCFANDGATKWVFHFDVNKTILVVDSVQRQSCDDFVNDILAGSYKYLWDEHLTEPVSYKHYVENFLDLSEDEAAERISQFIEFVNDMDHEFKNKVNEDAGLLYDKLTLQKTIVLLSFYKLISFLRQSGIDYTIILRSFGTDLDRVANEVNIELGEAFFDEYAHFDKGKLCVGEGTLTSPQEIYAYFSACSNLIVRDDYLWWKSHDKDSCYGKPFYFDFNDDSVVHVFFDDHIEENDGGKNIIAPCDATTGERIVHSKLLELGVVQRADPYQAILDDDYYLNGFLNLLNKSSSLD